MQEWPADRVERRPTDSLIPYARNARTHSDAQIAEIAASILQWGWTMPVLVDESGMLIAGHGRVLAARKLGYTEVPTVVAVGWTKAQKQAYVLADNKLAENAGWDDEMLRVELADLRELGADLSVIGFDSAELARLFATTQGRTDPDDVPATQSAVVSRLGDTWLLGRHRLRCGDSTDAEDVRQAHGSALPLLMVTDPPYGVAYDPSWRNRAGVSTSKRTGKVENDDRADWREAWALFRGRVAYVWHSALHTAEVAESLLACGFALRAQVIWAKERFVLGRGDYHWQHEPCWYAARGTGGWNGDRKQSTIWSITSRDQDANTIHSTQKPVEAMRRPMENNSKPGDAVYEPFCGSGTTIIAAEMSGRICCAIELNPTYVDVAVRRWEAFTGKVATLEADGRSFADTAASRGVPIESNVSGAARPKT